jgi:hypothetical protein
MVESTREYLRRRERELGEEIAKFEAERADVWRALAALGITTGGGEETVMDRASEIRKDTQEEAVEAKPVSRSKRRGSSYRRPTAREQINTDPIKMPLKPLMLRTLRDFFPEGTTSNELQYIIKQKWNRDIQLASIAVTLSDLKKRGEIAFRNRLWCFIEKEDGPL